MLVYLVHPIRLKLLLENWYKTGTFFNVHIAGRMRCINLIIQLVSSMVFPRSRTAKFDVLADL